MKKIGFTLAEVLITLGIIGVVAALTAPALIQDVGTAQIGPKLAKARSTIEIANQNLMSEKDSNKLIGALGIIPNNRNGNETATRYGELISDYMKIQSLNGDKWPTYYDYDGKDQVSNSFIITVRAAGGDPSALRLLIAGYSGYVSSDGMIYMFGISKPENLNDKPHRQIAGSVMVDINGLKGPNRFGRDTFLFTMMNDGSLKPLGSSSDIVNDEMSLNCNSEGVSGRGLTCTGSIFENGLKVIYK